MKIKMIKLVGLGLSILLLGGCAMSNSSDTNPTPIQNVAESDNPAEQTQENGYFIEVTGNRPFGIAFDNSGSMYMVTAPATGAGTLSKVSPDGAIEEIATLEGSFIGPGIDTDDNGNAYVTVGGKLLKVMPDGALSVASEGFTKCMDVKLDNQDNIFVADDGTDTIYMITKDNQKSALYKSETPGNFSLTSIAFDKGFKNLYAADNGKVLKFSRNSDGGFDEPSIVAEGIERLFFIGLDSSGTLYIDTTDAIRKVEEDGQVTEVIKDPLTTPLSFKFGGKGFAGNAMYIATTKGIYRFTP